MTELPQLAEFNALDPLPTKGVLAERTGILRAAVGWVSWGGPWAEFGVHKGWSARVLRNLQPIPSTLFLFDSWEGLPEDWIEDGQMIKPQGHFGNRSLQTVPGATIVKGLFEDTLPGFDFGGPLALIHVDSDLESSARTVLENVPVAPGTVIIFDEFCACDSGFKDRSGPVHLLGEGKAWCEIAERRGIVWRYAARASRQRVVVVVDSIGCGKPS